MQDIFSFCCHKPLLICDIVSKIRLLFFSLETLRCRGSSLVSIVVLVTLLNMKCGLEIEGLSDMCV